MERRDEEALALGVNFILKDRAKKAVNRVCVRTVLFVLRRGWLSNQDVSLRSPEPIVAN